MLRTSLISIFALSTGLGGCSHIPDPILAPQVEPYTLIQKVRCEIRQAVTEDHPKEPGLRDATIGYGLTLTAEEKRNNAASLDIVKAITLGTLSLGPSASVDHIRKAEVQTHLAEKIGKITDRPCQEPSSRELHKYPITGELGLRDVVRRFVHINRIGGIRSDKEKGYQQLLEFTLTYKAGLKPGFEVSKNVNTTNKGSLTITGERSDVHQLIVTIEPPAKLAPAVEKTPIEVKITNINEFPTIIPPEPTKSGEKPKVKKSGKAKSPEVITEIAGQDQAEPTARTRQSTSDSEAQRRVIDSIKATRAQESLTKALKSLR